MKKIKPVVVIGAGPAGMAAAIELAKAGVPCTVIDEAPRSGGQVYRQLPTKFQTQEKYKLNSEQKRGKNLHTEWLEAKDKINLLSSTSVVGIWNEKEVVYTSEGISGVIEAEQIIIATGAYERPVPFPGWTLPGVMTVGGVKSFIKTMYVKPGERAIIAGTGPLLISTANRLHEIGVNVIAVLEAGNPPWSSDAFSKEWEGVDFAQDIANDLEELKGNNIPLLFNHTIFEAHGKSEVTSVSYGEVDAKDWKPLNDTKRTINADLVALGFGFVSNIELSMLAGCKHDFHPSIGWYVVRNQVMETTVPGIFSVGDGAAIGGAIIAEQEGRIAGIKAAQNAGSITAGDAEKYFEKHLSPLHSFESFRISINEATAIRKGLLYLPKAETLVCRCEEVALSDVNTAIKEGAGDLQSVKLLTRLGMGPCQGRNCAPSMGMYLCETLKRTPQQVGRISSRPPVKPITLGAFAKLAKAEETVQSDSFDAINAGGRL
jgi:thioredoxin reductase